MSHDKAKPNKIILSIFLANLIFVGGLQASSSKVQVCKGDYALCTSAKCLPVPGQPDKAICYCTTQEGYSAGYEPCSDAKVSKDGYKEIKSRYYPADQVVTCSNNRPWANCLDSPCIVGKNNPFEAICACTTVAGKGKYLLPSDACNELKCDSGFWSGAALSDSKDFESQIVEAQKEGKFPKISSEPCS